MSGGHESDKTAGTQYGRKVSRQTSHEFMKTVATVISKGFGMPSVFCDEVCIDRLVNVGIPLSDARDYAASGCVEIVVQGKWQHRANGMTYINFGKVLELTLHNSTEPKSGITLIRVKEEKQ